MDMVRERELNVPIFQKQKSYQAQAVRRKYIKPPFVKQLVRTSLVYRSFFDLCFNDCPHFFQYRS